jgi:hypothetical protein
LGRHHYTLFSNEAPLPAPQHPIKVRRVFDWVLTKDVHRVTLDFNADK